MGMSERQQGSAVHGSVRVHGHVVVRASRQIVGFGWGSALAVVFRQIEIILKDSTAFVYVTKSEKSSH